MKKHVLFTVALLTFLTIGVFSQPQSPVLVGPPDEVDVALTPVTLDWADVPGAHCYRVEVYTDTTDPDKFEDVCNAPTSHYDLPITETLPDVKYYWRVFACSDQGWSAPSEYFSFTTADVTAEGSIGNMVDGVIDLIADNQISQNQGNILINRLHQAQQKLQNGQNFPALVQMIIFKARVLILRLSNQISAPVSTRLNYGADGVIDLIIYDDNPVNSPGVNLDDYLLPKSFELSQNYPNPFNPSTTIEYSIPKNAEVTLKIYDIVGREVATLVNEYKSTGKYIVNWNASNLASGPYFYRLSAGDFTQTKKMFLVK